MRFHQDHNWWTSSHVLWDPSPGGAGEQPNANASVDGRARLPREERGESRERESNLSSCVWQRRRVDDSALTRNSLFPSSLCVRPFPPSVQSLPRSGRARRERRPSSADSDERRACRKDEERRKDPIVVGGSGGDDREGRLRKEGDSGDVCRAAAGTEGRTRGGTTPKGGMKE